MNYSDSVKTSRMNAVVTAIGTSGLMRLYTNSGKTTQLASFTLAATAGVVAGTGTVTLTLSDQNGGTAGILGPATAAAGTATYGELQTSGGTMVVSFSVSATGGGGELILDNNVFQAGQSVTINSAVITHG
jgi:hypothetical protein